MQLRTLLNAVIHPSPDSYALVRAVFVRLLGVVYLIAFASFGVQMAGLVGSEGILPAAEFLDRVRDIFGAGGYRLAPTVFWVSASDAALTAGMIAGLALSVCLIVGFLQRTALVALYVLYLSFVSVGQVFMAYQWDTLLLEVGFLSIFLAIPGPAVVWLFRALVFRFWFLSGAVKLLSDDPTWSSLTALTYHYETQPLPTWVAWYAHHLPEGFTGWRSEGCSSWRWSCRSWCSAPAPPFLRGGLLHGAERRHRRHRKLHILQPPLDHPVRVPARRRPAPEDP